MSAIAADNIIFMHGITLASRECRPVISQYVTNIIAIIFRTEKCVIC